MIIILPLDRNKIEALKRTRRAYGISQAEVAKRMGISRCFFASLESGARTTSTLYKHYQNYRKVLEEMIDEIEEREFWKERGE